MKKTSPPMTSPIPWLKDHNASSHHLRVYDKLTKRRGKHVNSQDTEKRGITKG